MEVEDILDVDIEELARAVDEDQARQAAELLAEAPIRLTRARSMLGVTDVTARLWCEMQLHLSRVHRVRRETASMRSGKELHHARESELHEVAEVRVESREDKWGLRLLRMVFGVRELGRLGITREVPVLGCISVACASGKTRWLFVYGIIDELVEGALGSPATATDGSASRKRPRDSKARCVRVRDLKTRRRARMPGGDQKLSARLQCMLYQTMARGLRAAACGESDGSPLLQPAAYLLGQTSLQHGTGSGGKNDAPGVFSPLLRLCPVPGSPLEQAVEAGLLDPRKRRGRGARRGRDAVEGGEGEKQEGAEGGDGGREGEAGKGSWEEERSGEVAGLFGEGSYGVEEEEEEEEEAEEMEGGFPWRALCAAQGLDPAERFGPDVQAALAELGLGSAMCLRDLFPLALQEWRCVLPLSTGLEIEYVQQPTRAGEAAGADTPASVPSGEQQAAATAEAAAPAAVEVSTGDCARIDGAAVEEKEEEEGEAGAAKTPKSIGVDTFEYFEPFAAEQLLRATAYWLGVSEPEARCSPAERWKCRLCPVQEHCGPLSAALAEEEKDEKEKEKEKKEEKENVGGEEKKKGEEEEPSGEAKIDADGEDGA